MLLGFSDQIVDMIINPKPVKAATVGEANKKQRQIESQFFEGAVRQMNLMGQKCNQVPKVKATQSVKIKADSRLSSMQP